VRIGKPNNISGAIEQASSPSYAGAIGLAQWKIFKKEIINIDTNEPLFKNALNKIKTLIKEFF